MSGRQKDPLRELTQDERQALARISRSQRESAAQVARAKALLGVAEGHSHTKAAQLAGRTSNDAVSRLVSRFNKEGIKAVVPRQAGGPEVVYGATERERILAEVRRTPDREADGTATWSLSSLQRSLRKQGMSTVSTHTIFVLHEAGLSWQRERSWCETGSAWRTRQGIKVLVHAPDTEANKSS